MLKNIKQVTIVGGGSAGWMAASMFVRTFPEWSINLIESPDYPIVGVGESTLLSIREFFYYLGFSEDEQHDIMRATDASYKMSIKFTDFYEKDAGGFHYPFGKPVTFSDDALKDWTEKKAIFPDTPVTDFVNCHFPSSYLFENNKFSTNYNGDFLNFNPEKDCSYHFDATKLGQWLKNNYCIPRGLNLIADTVDYVETDDSGVRQLILKSGKTLQSDLYVDCTGFKSLLLSQTLQSPFTSFEDILPNNRAWAVHLPYNDKEKELEGFTNSTAIGNGWCWNIPLWSRIGTGYVYSDSYISPEDAKEEFKQYLMSDKVVIPRTRDEVESLVYRDIQMRVGMHKESFYKNVVGIGLAAGFIEPLESNGLLTVHYNLFKLMRCLSRGTVTQFDRDGYNRIVYNNTRGFAEFVAMHYALSIRDDTDYWRSIAHKKFEEGSEIENIVERKYISGDLHLTEGTTYITVGMHYQGYDNIMRQSDEFWETNDSDKDIYQVINLMEKAKKEWKTASDKAPTLYKYLRDNIHI
tara:strand:- start:413 stop:1978 length:1566 start_codon:yes stop_codon:yes gene_type:complete